MRSPRPLGSVASGTRTVGAPAPRSVTSTRIRFRSCSTFTVNSVSVWRTQLVASSETITATSSTIARGASANRSTT
jgi:hypothetical protein